MKPIEENEIIFFRSMQRTLNWSLSPKKQLSSKVEKLKSEDLFGTFKEIVKYQRQRGWTETAQLQTWTLVAKNLWSHHILIFVSCNSAKFRITYGAF